ncbi:Surfeit locus protein 5 subunit 22 of Mediator complex [Microdochium nivale]|nr:Surfeit locus protein 5 subunit 22 of Mediator complex [Microdochium nivale]
MESRKKGENSILDRHNRMIAQILTRFRNMVMAATEPLPRDGAIVETATLNSMTMETETQALITEIQNLLTLNREIKALWIKGALRKPGDDAAREAELDRKAELATDLFNQVMARRGGVTAVVGETQAAAVATAGDGAGGGKSS